MTKLVLVIAMLLIGATAHAQQFTTVYNPPPGFSLGKPEIVRTPQGLHLFVPNRDVATGRTRLDWCRLIGSSCSWTTIDGSKGDLEIPQAQQLRAYLWSGDGRVHVFYSNHATGSNVLRHGTLVGLNWQFEDLDGQGGPNGRIVADVGGHQLGVGEAVVGGQNTLAVSYTSWTTADLRVARLTAAGWTFQTVDGQSSTGGRFNGAAAAYSTLAVWSGNINVLYTANATGIRRATLANNAWSYETLPVTSNGTQIAARPSATHLHVFFNFYNEDTQIGELHHAWVPDHGAWSSVKHDGGATTFAYTSGGACSAGSPSEFLFFPYSSLDLGSATTFDLRITYSYGSTPWSYGTLDGHVDDGIGRITGSVGRVSSCAGDPSRVHLVYSYDLPDGRQALRYGYMVHSN